MKTYSEKNGKKKFDWYKFLTRKKISENEWDDASNRTRTWVTCPCGNQCYIIQRNGGGEPVDKKLRNYGLAFTDEVYRRNAKKALHILDKI